VISSRSTAALLLILLLPLQGVAAACAQICAYHHAQAQSQSDEDDSDTDHCGKSDIGAGKCCQAHTFIAVPALSFDPVLVSSPEPDRRVMRWTNFIPEEPNPPPIGAAPIA
jgi:hypothetical protein